MKDRFDNILVISLQGIGDLLLATPLLHGLKINYPKSRLTVLTLEANEDVLNDNEDIDEIIVFKAERKNNVIEIMNLVRKIRAGHFDLAICAYPSGLRSAFLAFVSGAKERVGQELNLFNGYRWLFTKMVPINEVKHAVLLNLDFLKILGVDAGNMPKDLMLKISDADDRFASNLMRENGIKDEDILVAMHPGGGSERSWPKERFGEAADVLIERHNAKIIFVGSAKEIPLIEEIQRRMKAKSINCAGRTSLSQMGGILKKSKLLVCNNSGPMHIAAALRTRTVSFAGPVDVRMHGPWGEGHIVLQGALDCGPCYYPFFRDTLEETKLKNRWFGKRFICDTGGYRCLTDIATGQVLEAAEKILKGDR